VKYHLLFKLEFQFNWNSFFVPKATTWLFMGVWDFSFSYSILHPQTISKASCIISGLSFCNTNLSRCVRIFWEYLLNLSSENFSHFSFCLISSFLISVFISCNLSFWACNKSGNFIKLLILIIIFFCFEFFNILFYICKIFNKYVIIKCNLLNVDLLNTKYNI